MTWLHRAVLGMVVVLLTSGVAWAGKEDGRVASEEGQSEQNLDTQHFKMLRSKNNTLCVYVRDLLTRDIIEGHKWYLSDRIFTAIEWEPIGEPWQPIAPWKEYNYYGEVARFDIDNDGVVDVVVRHETVDVKVHYMQLLILDPAQYKGPPKTEKALIKQAKGWVNVRGTDFWPFIFQKQAYLLSMQAELAEHSGDGFYGVERYVGGKVGKVSPAGEEGTDEVEVLCGIQRW
ncbi:MAG: hypothetical protein OEY28_14545 [Nitrospira sp.]|nr:hypothetical protein [Nitrospira sp.]